MSRPTEHARPTRANSLDGATWTRYSISIWSDLRKTAEEAALGHPAMFPMALPARLIECLCTADDRVILDPFCGIGSTPLAARQSGRVGIGVDISAEFIAQTRARLGSADGPGEAILRVGDARSLADFVPPASVDMVITSPPYWDILLARRSADGKPTRHYGDAPADLGKVRDYARFLDGLEETFRAVLAAMRPGKYCCVVVMDLRKGSTFYPFHADFCQRAQGLGFILDDIIIWDRRQEYNNLRPLGYPYRFRINKVHEFILIFRVPGVRV